MGTQADIYIDEDIDFKGVRVVKKHILDVLLVVVFILGCLTGGFLTSAFILLNFGGLK